MAAGSRTARAPSCVQPTVACALLSVSLAHTMTRNQNVTRKPDVNMLPLVFYVFVMPLTGISDFIAQTLLFGSAI